MTDGDLNLVQAESLIANITAPEERLAAAQAALEVPEIQAVPEVNISAALVTVESPESAAAIETGTDEQELVLQEVESEAIQSDTDDFDIVDEPAPKVGFVKRWTRKIVGWVKRVFKWRKD